MTLHLLPPNASDVEIAVSLATARIDDMSAPARLMWDPATVPAAFLPWLAWSLSVDNWDPTWPENVQRMFIAASVEIHRIKGTKRAIQRALDSIGFGDAVILEFYGIDFYDGAYTYNGARTYAVADEWADYRLILNRPVSVAQSDVVRRLLNNVAPARCRLAALDFTQALNLYAGTTSYNGSFTCGPAPASGFRLLTTIPARTSARVGRKFPSESRRHPVSKCRRLSTILRLKCGPCSGRHSATEVG